MADATAPLVVGEPADVRTSEEAALDALDALVQLLGRAPFCECPAFARAAPLSKVLTSGAPSLRRSAAKKAADMGDTLVLADMALLDDEIDLRIDAVRLLLGLSAAEPLRHVALVDPDLLVRLRAVDALGDLANAVGLGVAMSDLHVEVRKKAVAQLGKNKGFEQLHAFGLSDSAAAVRAAVVEWLAQLGQPLLLTDALRDPDPQLRVRVLMLLEAEAQRGAIALAATEDSEPKVRLHALEALARLKDVDAIAAGPLLDPIETTRKRAVDLLGSLQADVPLGRVALADASPRRANVSLLLARDDARA